jgi:hypothetical protein
MLIIHAYGLFLAVPVFAAILAMTLQQSMILPLVLPIAVVVATAWFLPLGLGNPYVRRLVFRAVPAARDRSDGFIVQISGTPRIRSGVLAAFEDADDIGYLRVTEAGVHFEGDSVQLILPAANIKEVRLRNIGLRGLFLYGPPIQLTVSGLPQLQSIEIAERSSLMLPGSRRNTRELYAQFHSLRARS